MSVLVQQADEQINAIEQNATTVEHDMEQGNVQVDKAITHARNARRMRWICFWITLVVVIIIAAVLAWYFTIGPEGKKHQSS
jgi:syntaxin 1B/2/3